MGCQKDNQAEQLMQLIDNLICAIYRHLTFRGDEIYWALADRQKLTAQSLDTRWEENTR